MLKFFMSLQNLQCLQKHQLIKQMQKLKHYHWKQKCKSENLKTCTLFHAFLLIKSLCFIFSKRFFFLKSFLFHLFYSLKSRLTFFRNNCLEITYMLSCHSFESHWEKINWYDIAKIFLRSCILWSIYIKTHTKQNCQTVLKKMWVMGLFLIFLILLEEFIHFQKIKIHSCIYLNKWWKPICSFTSFGIEIYGKDPSFILGKLSPEKRH